MNKNKEQMTSLQEEAFVKYSVPRVLVKFIITAALSQLTFLILNLADAFFVGRTGDTFQISAMTITFPVVMLITCIGTIFGVGANANMAAELGKENRERAKTFSTFSVYVAGAVTIILLLILLALKEPLLYTIGTDENSVGFCELFNAVFQSISKWKISMANTVINKGFLLTPVMVLLANLMGINGIIISQPITENLTAIALFIIYLKVMKIEKNHVNEDEIKPSERNGLSK